MTQIQSKQTPSLVSVDRSGRIPTAVRAADASNDSRGSEPTRLSAATGSSAAKEDVFAGFVFEEVGAPAREPVLQSVKRSGQPANESSSGQAASAPVVAAPAAVKDAPQESKRADAPSTPPAAESTNGPVTGVSVRSDLDLRGKLNQKEAELLALRVELSARDRRIVDLNTASLEIERSRIELTEQLEQNAQQLSDTFAKVRSLEAEREATAKRIEDMNASFRRSEISWKRKTEGEIDALKGAHTAELAEQAGAHATKLELLERSHAAEVARVHAMHAAAEQAASEKHSEAIKNLEAASNTALSNAVAAYTKKIRALRETQEKSIAQALAADAASLEAALAAAASDKAGALAEAESAHRATQSELSATLATAQFLERTQVSQSEQIARQESKIAALEEALKRATSQSDAAADTLAKLRRAFAAGLHVLNAQSRLPEDD